MRALLAALRLIHPAPAFAVTLLSAALGLILLSRAGQPADERWWLTVLAVAGSQVFTGATNDLADRDRDQAAGRMEKPLVAGHISPNAALWVASGGLAVQLATSLWLGAAPLVLGLVATASAVGYNLALSRTPYSFVPYLVSFGILPLWIASGVGFDLGLALPAVPLASLLAVAAHLANTLRDFDSDAAAGSRSLAQVIGRQSTRRLAVVSAMAAGLGMVLALALAGDPDLVSFALSLAGVAVLAIGARFERGLWYSLLIAAVAWTAAWATGVP
jgi:4-hydroxybenzoate polyprenyltransferase